MMQAEHDTILEFVPTISTRVIAPRELVEVLPALTSQLVEVVNSGAALGFMPPLDEDLARDYWISLLPELRSGRRLLFVATVDGRVAGSAQLVPSHVANAPHRAAVEKVFVDRSHQRRGVGTTLMFAIEELALHYGRTLLVLNTRYDEAAHHWYRSLGYHDGGVVPGWSIGPGGQPYTDVTMYKQLRLPTRLFRASDVA
jgi:GNAT superfamily N-acetyltransferase